jgi:hypothetical protein
MSLMLISICILLIYTMWAGNNYWFGCGRRKAFLVKLGFGLDYGLGVLRLCFCAEDGLRGRDRFRDWSVDWLCCLKVVESKMLLRHDVCEVVLLGWRLLSFKVKFSLDAFGRTEVVLGYIETLVVAPRRSDWPIRCDGAFKHRSWLYWVTRSRIAIASRSAHTFWSFAAFLIVVYIE